jgi:2,3-bisphosphoglycerate-dependent phosphoglycerate mutase
LLRKRTSTRSPTLHTTNTHTKHHYPGIKEDQIPQSESLKDVTVRTSEFWDDVIVPQLKLNKKLMIVGHENNLRSIIKRLDGISEADIINVELPRAVPLLYHLDPETLKPIKSDTSDPADLLSGTYLFDKV